MDVRKGEQKIIKDAVLILDDEQVFGIYNAEYAKKKLIKINEEIHGGARVVKIEDLAFIKKPDLTKKMTKEELFLFKHLYYRDTEE